jgi:SPP1 gp7 family putative phage head morphogenesis protein
MIDALIEFFDAPTSVSFKLPPLEALAFWKAKGLKATFDYRDMLGEEHVAAFTVAKMMDTDMLADVHASLTAAMEQGRSYQEWAMELQGYLQQRGWWGREAVTDPLTGQTIVAQLGSPGRLKTIFRTNLQSAYAAGAWEQIDDQKTAAPFLLYDAVDDHRTREEHAEHDDKVYPVDDPFWATWYPPNGYNCRCGVIQLDADEVASLGLKVSPPTPVKTEKWTNPRTGKTERVVVGQDPGFGFNVGKIRLDNLAKLALEKAMALAPAQQAAALQGIEAAKQAAQKALEADVLDAQKALAKASGQDNLVRAQMKAAQRAAQFKIDKAIAEKTPYLSTAIKALQGKGLTPAELLEVATAQAAKAKQSNFLSEWKKAYLADKKPTANAQAAFDALPKDAQDALTQTINQQKAAAQLQAAAEKKLAEVKAGTVAAQKAILDKLELDPAFLAKSPLDKLAQYQDELAKFQAAKNQASALSNYKKNVLAGKPPSEGQQAAFNALTPEQQAKFLAKLQKELDAKAPPVAPTAPPPLNVEPPPATLEAKNLTQIGPQKGSNPGGLYQDTTTGQKYYVKLLAEDKARNEFLAAELYKLVGAEVPDLTIIPWPDGRLGLASKWVDGLKKGKPGDLFSAEGAKEFFAADAWLANWDVVGLDFDNLALLGNRAFRVDVGGSLRYRAQGTLKGADWNDTVREIDSLRDGTNSQAARVFGSLTESQLIDSVKRVLKPSDADIAALVERYGPSGAEGRELLRTLLARREYLRNRFPAAVEVPPPPPVIEGRVRVTESEFKQIEASRSNGYTIRTDGDAIEDHNVLIAHHIRDGKKFTRVSLKLTDKATEAVRARLQPLLASNTAAAVEVSLGNVKSSLLQWVKGVNLRTSKGEVLQAKDIERAMVALDKVEEAIKQLDNARSSVAPTELAAINAVQKTVVGYYKDLKAFLSKAKANQVFPNVLPKLELDGLDDVAKFKRPATAAPNESSLTWTRTEFLPHERSKLQKGYNVHGPSKDRGEYTGDYVFTGNGKDGERILAMVGSSTQRAVSGTVWMDIPGADLAAAQRAFDIIEDTLGVKAARTTDIERSEQYLNAFARVRLFKNTSLGGWANYRTLDDIEDAAKRVEAKLDFLTKETNTDIRKSLGWQRRDGNPQAFGHGRISQHRPDTDTPEWQEFEKEHGLYHNTNGLDWDSGTRVASDLLLFLESGGNILSQMERLRRGIYGEGASPEPDRRTGGASYVFTRLFNRKSSALGTGRGFYWKASAVRRLDAVSFERDLFGETTDNVLRQARRSTPSELRGAAKGGGNETNFKHGLSLFDDLDAIVLSANQVATTIAEVRKLGYARWPDGRELEDVIISVDVWTKTRSKRG